MYIVYSIIVYQSNFVHQSDQFLLYFYFNFIFFYESLIYFFPFICKLRMTYSFIQCQCSS
jgi:hypothetical protein